MDEPIDGTTLGLHSGGSEMNVREKDNVAGNDRIGAEARQALFDPPIAFTKGPSPTPPRQLAPASPGLDPRQEALIARVPARPSSRKKRRRSTVSVVIPAKNEARNLAFVLEELPTCVDEIILVDGCSSDCTRTMAVSCRADVRIVTDPEAGKGNALRAGFHAAGCDIIVALDADGSMSPREIPSYLYFLENGFDFVKGSRFMGGGGSLDITSLRRLGNRSLLAVANRLFSVQLTDLCYGFFAFRRKYLDNLGLSSSGFEIETELVVRAVKAGLRIAEVPSMEMPRRSGRSNLRSIPDGYRVLQTLLREWREESVPAPLPPAAVTEQGDGPSGPTCLPIPTGGPSGNDPNRYAVR